MRVLEVISFDCWGLVDQYVFGNWEHNVMVHAANPTMCSTVEFAGNPRICSLTIIISIIQFPSTHHHLI